MAKKQSIDITKIDLIAELQRAGWKYEEVGAYELRCVCPAHDDTSPSACVNIEKNTWVCHSCKAKGDAATLLAYIYKVNRKTILVDLCKRYDIEIKKFVNPVRVEEFHDKIWDAHTLRQKLYDRGITDEMIRSARLGYDEGRVIIPVYDQSGRVINLRKYLPGAPGPEKMRNLKGYAHTALYQVEQCKYDKIWILSGELKALAAGYLLNNAEIGATSITAGEGAWDVNFNHLFKGKEVYICYDIDNAGLSGGRKVASKLFYDAELIKMIQLPLDIDKFPKGDFNDWMMHGASLDKCLALMEQSEEFILNADTDEEDKSSPVPVKLVNSTRSEHIGKYLKFEAMVAACDTNPFLIPGVIDCSCTRDQPNCSYCPIRAQDPDPVTGLVRIEISPTTKGIVGMINAPSSTLTESLKQAAHIPKCKSVEFKVKKHLNAFDVRLTPQLAVSEDNSEHVVQPAIIISEDQIELNTPYMFFGRVHPHPKTQQAVLVIDSREQSVDSLSSFKLSSSELAELRIFRPDSWSLEDLSSKLQHIHRDISSNVTKIFERFKLHFLIDLTYFSPLYFIFDGDEQKGWVNTCVTGDSSQGKSEATLRLIEHYGLGIRHDCKNATSAGLLGGLQQLGTRWFVSWGVIPLHDKRLVVMEELKGTPHEVIGKLTDMRSSGIAEITKIEARRAHARTRLLMISNPRSDRPISAYNFGVEAIKELIGSLEDIRRFDCAIILSAEEVDAGIIGKLNSRREKVDHTYTSSLCKKLVLWAWTRSSNQVVFEKSAEELCSTYGADLCSKYSESLPLVDRGTMRYKLARLAAALAARTFSTSEKAEDILVVRDCHVQFVYQFLCKEYNNPYFGYADYSKAIDFANRVLDPDMVKNRICSTKYPRDLVEQMLYTEDISIADICDWCEYDRDYGQRLLSFLVRKHALYRSKRTYIKTSEFISLLKDMKSSGLVNNPVIQEGEEF